MDQNDLKQIGDLIDTKLDSKLENNNKILASLMDIKLKNLKDEISEDFEVKMLTWKSEIMNSVDALAGEIRDERDFRTIASHQISELEKKVGADE